MPRAAKVRAPMASAGAALMLGRTRRRSPAGAGLGGAGAGAVVGGARVEGGAAGAAAAGVAAPAAGVALW